MADLFDIANLITAVGVDGVKIKPEPGLPEKSSNEILTELFSTFDEPDDGVASPENSEQQAPGDHVEADKLETQTKKKKLKKKHKHKEKKHKKKSKHNSSDSNSDVESNGKLIINIIQFCISLCNCVSLDQILKKERNIRRNPNEDTDLFRANRQTLVKLNVKWQN